MLTGPEPNSQLFVVKITSSSSPEGKQPLIRKAFLQTTWQINGVAADPFYSLGNAVNICRCWQARSVGRLCLGFAPSWLASAADSLADGAAGRSRRDRAVFTGATARSSMGGPAARRHGNTAAVWSGRTHNMTAYKPPAGAFSADVSLQDIGGPWTRKQKHPSAICTSLHRLLEEFRETGETRRCQEVKMRLSVSDLSYGGPEGSTKLQSHRTYPSQISINSVAALVVPLVALLRCDCLLFLLRVLFSCWWCFESGSLSLFKHPESTGASHSDASLPRFNHWPTQLSCFLRMWAEWMTVN